MVEAIPNDVLGPALLVLVAALIRMYGRALMVWVGLKEEARDV